MAGWRLTSSSTFTRLGSCPEVSGLYVDFFEHAFQHPALVHRLVVVSAPYAQNGFFAEMLTQQAAVGAAMADAMKDTPMYKGYAAIAPRPQDFPRLLDTMGEYTRQPYDWSASVKQLSMPVMLVFGDSDIDPSGTHRVLLPAVRRRAKRRRLDT